MKNSNKLRQLYNRSLVGIFALFVFCLVISSQSLLAQDDVKIGILAFRPIPQTEAQWLPLSAALENAIPKHRFVIKAYQFDQLQDAVANRQIDFVLTNPGHYILMRQRVGLSPPIATLVELEQGKAVSRFGGVMFTLAQRSDIQSLEDFRGKTVAATATDSLGGYQMQAYSLSKIGLNIPKDIFLYATGMPHDNVVLAVLSAKADIGFVRSGLLEKMVQEGKLDPAKIKLINKQNQPDYPVPVSTLLYPEWAFAPLPHTSEDLKRQLASFLLSLAKKESLANELKIHGFDVPADYSSVEDVLRELRMPPFDD